MRAPSAFSRDNSRADVAMTPMIDVVFLLLIFFVWTASFQVVEALLPSELAPPTAVGSTTDLKNEDFERITVQLTLLNGKVNWRVNGQPITGLVALSERLKLLAGIRADLPVVIDPAEEVPLGDVIDVYDAARNAGLANIQFTTE